MNIVLFTHPQFMSSQSMPRFAHMLEQAYRAQGHAVQVWAPKAYIHRWISINRFSKWAGYIDQYVLFPIWVRNRLQHTSAETLFVFCDQALGPWVPLVSHRPHVVHVHDLLALRSALGLVPENPTSWSGRIYQRYIRSGFKKAKHFISISRKTKHDLHQHGEVSPVISEVVYNGLNFPFAPMAPDEAFRHLDRAGLPVKRDGMLLHVSGGQWYKNMPGVIRLYAEYSKRVANPLPLWCISPNPSATLQTLLDDVPPQGRVFFFQGLGNESLEAAYSMARVFLLPSHAEGFGWPIVEAQACGCPVITTGEPPMNEVGGPGTRFLPRLRVNSDVNAWAMNGAAVLIEVLSMNDSDRLQVSQRGIDWAARFDADSAIAGYLNIYSQILP